MKKFKLMSVFIFIMNLNTTAQNIALTNVSVQVAQAQNSLGNKDLQINFQQKTTDNNDWNNKLPVMDNSNQINEQEEVNTEPFSFQMNNVNLGIKKLTMPKIRETAPSRISRKKKKNRFINHFLFRTSKKLDTVFAKRSKKRSVNDCFVW